MNARAATTAALLAAVLAGAVVLASIDPATTTLIPPCPTRALAGVYCPGCGCLRALHALLRGHVAAALRFNALAIVLAPAVVIALAIELSASLGYTPAQRVRLAPWCAWTLFVVICLFGIFRNTALGGWLAPG